MTDKIGRQQFESWPSLRAIINKTLAYTNETEVQDYIAAMENGIRTSIMELIIDSASKGLNFVKFKSKLSTKDIKKDHSIKIAVTRILNGIAEELDDMGYITIMFPHNDGHCELVIIWSEYVEEDEEDELGV